MRFKKQIAARITHSKLKSSRAGGKKKHSTASAAPTKLTPQNFLSPVPLSSQQRSWFLIEAVRISHAFEGLDGTSDSEYRLLKAIIRGCYPPSVIAEQLAQDIAADEKLGKEFRGLVLRPVQMKSFPPSLHDAQAAIHYLKYAVDAWPGIDFDNPSSKAALFNNLSTVMQIFERRASGESTDLDKEFGFTAGGRGKTSQASKSRSRNDWSENCFDVHVLHLSGKPIDEACRIYVCDENRGKITQSEASLQKMYKKWRDDPATAVQLQVGDELAVLILAQPPAKEIIAKRFPPS